MKKILSKVTVAESHSVLGKLNELLAQEGSGHYWLHQLGLLMRKEPTHVLTEKWLKHLGNRFNWKHAEEHFLKTRDLWFNEPEWPFQIAVLSIGGVNNEMLLIKWKDEVLAQGDEFHADIKHVPIGQKRKICLIRIQGRLLGFKDGTHTSHINCSHPLLNFYQCPPETPFFMRTMVKEYFGSDLTVMAMENFILPNMKNQKEKKLYYFNHDRGYGNDIHMGSWDISPEDTSTSNIWWIFKYDVPEGWLF